MYDLVNWSFVSRFMCTMGLNTQLYFTKTRSLYLNFQVMFAGDVAQESIHQGCPLSSLLFAFATHPLALMLSKLANNIDVVGLHLPSRSKIWSRLFFHVFTRLHRKYCEREVHLASIYLGFKITCIVEECSSHILYPLFGRLRMAKEG